LAKIERAGHTDVLELQSTESRPEVTLEDADVVLSAALQGDLMLRPLAVLVGEADLPPVPYPPWLRLAHLPDLLDRAREANAARMGLRFLRRWREG
jgi:hypothetical protein